MVEIGLVGSISSSTKELLGDPHGITTAMEVGDPLITMATTVTTTHGVAIGMTLGTTEDLDTTGATDVLGVASMPDGVATGVATMAVITVVTMEAMPIATGMATAMADTMAVGIDTTAPLALATVEAVAGTMIDLRTTPSTDVPLVILAAQ